ncbi:MAG TPA: hypothetical protein VD713_04880, partial [Sphingomonadales bacterium]|nr:hypothetical protein [Sphingomonadales bacterium]
RLKEGFRIRFGSRDYRMAGALRETLVATVTEDLSGTARRVRAPALFIYGAEDAETPPELGERFQALIPGVEYVVLPGLDHYNVLERGIFQVEVLVRKFLQNRVGA